MSGITMRDIGRQLGVSAVTVSKALAGKSGVSEEMRQKIIRRASELGYVNPNAPQTTPTSGLDVGILIPENFFSVVSFYATFYKQLVQALTDAGHFGIMELVTHDMQTALTLPNLLRSRHVDALICLGQLTSPYMQLLTRQEMPVICLDFHDPFVTTDAIVSDNAFGAAQLTYWLIEQGHRDIGFVGDIKATSSIMERYLGFLSAMLMKDLPVRPECVFSDRDPEGSMFHVLILVFDAYRVPGSPGSIEQYHNIHVVYTKEAETADMFIEHVTHEIGKGRRVRVATSDGMEQIIILGHGALRVSARMFHEEVQNVEKQIRKLVQGEA